ncbi:AtpZ/AtpI family protein [Bacillus sp. FJAT-29790]|uniref:AtpZ/AtpI family protein n=1 Tax=Bacillus sp. FJAT-29790 TaxID=1895002 RepID=UPI001C22BA17|nr:AtpZ/AtpI family protein [Bacillus sp. FJAT-29790]MBU8881054.1 AtpZ/AtpI family protein [Bacillus sp. FJAT-29790]
MRKNNRNSFQAIGLMSGILSQLVGSILLGIFLGRWADKLTASEPLFLIIGLLLGLSTGIFAMLRLIKHFFTGE